MTIRIQKQIQHIKEHLAAFHKHVGDDRTVESYFDDYYDDYEYENGKDGLYICLCHDLGIQPKP